MKRSLHASYFVTNSRKLVSCFDQAGVLAIAIRNAEESVHHQWPRRRPQYPPPPNKSTSTTMIRINSMGSLRDGDGIIYLPPTRYFNGVLEVLFLIGAL